MQRGKRILSVLMSAVLAVGLMPAPALAVDGMGAREDSTGLIAGIVNDLSSDGLLEKQVDAMNERALDALTADGGTIVQVDLGGSCSAAIASDGSLWTWGLNYCGQLGNGTTEDYCIPVKVMDDVFQVALGTEYSAAVKTDGSLWAWGRNYRGQLGDGTTVDRHSPVKVMDGVSQVALSDSHSAAVKSDGSLWTWGLNYNGELGDGTTVDRHSPVKVMDGVSQVALCDCRSAAVTIDGSLWKWGENGWDSLYGQEEANHYYYPTKVMDNVTQVFLGVFHSAVVKSDGALWTWGLNNSGDLGDGTERIRHAPVKVLEGVLQASLANSNTAALKLDGSLWTWGFNGTGMLGDGTTADSCVPKCIFSNGDWLYGSSDATDFNGQNENKKYKLESVGLTYNKVSQGKNLLKDVVTFDPNNKNTPVALQVKFKKSNLDVGKVQLVQTGGNGKGKKSVVATANSKFALNGLYVKNFQENAKFSVRVYDSAGKLRCDAPLALSVKHAGLSASMSFGDGFKFTIQDGFLQGSSIELGDISCPVTWKMDSDGKVQVGINFDVMNSDGDSIIDALKKGVDFKNSPKMLTRAMKKPDACTELVASEFKPSMKVIGYAEAPAGSSMLTGSITAEFGVGYYHEFQIAAIPCLVGEFSASASAKGGSKATIDASAPPKEMVKNASMDLGAKGSIGLYCGVGVAKLASAGAYAKGSFEYNHRVFPRSQSGPLDLIVKGEVGVKVKALGRNIATAKLLEGSMVLYKRDGNYSLQSRSLGMATIGSAAAVSKVDDEVGELIHGGDSASSNWHGGGSSGRLRALSAGVVPKTAVLANDVYPDASPRLVSAGGTAVLFFLDSASGRAQADRSQLVYSILDPVTGVWSEPAAIDDDGTADFSFDICANGDRVDVVWQDAAWQLNAQETLSEVAGSVGLSYASVDVAKRTVSAAEEVIAAGGGYPTMPRVGSDGSGVEVAWVTNDASSVLADEGSNAVMAAARAEGGTWGASALSSLGPSVPTSLDVGMDGSVLSAAWSYDADGDLADSADARVASESRGEVASGEVGNAQYVSWGGSGILSYAADGGIANASSGGFVMPEGSLESGEYELVTAEGSAAMVVQSCVSDESTSVRVCMYDSSRGSWGEPFDAAEYEGSALGLSAAMAGSTPIFAAAVEQGGGADSDGAVRLVASKPPAAKQVVRSLELAGTPQVNNGEVSLTATVANEGVFALSSPTIEVLDVGGNVVASVPYDGEIGPGAEVEIPVSVEVPEGSASSLTYRAVPSGGGANEAEAVEVCTENLSLSVDHSVEGDSEEIVAHVANEGRSASQAGSVEVFNWETDEVIATLDLPAIEPGTSVDVSYSPGVLLASAGVSSAGVRLVYDGEQCSTADDVAPVAVWDGGSLSQGLYSADDSPVTMVAKPAAKSFTYDGKSHRGVATSSAYSLSGTQTATKVGSYTAKATLKDGYLWADGSADAVTLGWEVVKASVSNSSISLSKSGFTYNGKKQVPAVKSVKVGTVALVKGADYSLSYLNASKKTIAASKVVSAGTYYVKVVGKGNYKGTAVKKFTIAKAANPMNVVVKSPQVKYSKKAQVVAASKAYTFKKKAVGTVAYARVAGGSSKWLPSVNKKTGAITVKAGAPKGKTQSVKVKVTAAGNANYKSLTKTVTVKVKVK